MGERIPACASYLAGKAALHLADAISTAMQNSDRVFPPSLVNEAFESARESLCPKRLRAIMGTTGDNWTREAYASAIKLSNESLVSAFGDRALWDRRRTARTRRRLLAKLADDHIRRWCADRGMKGERNDNRA